MPDMTLGELHTRLETVLAKLPSPTNYEPFDWKPWEIVSPTYRLPYIQSRFEALTASGKRWDVWADMDIPELEGAQWETKVINELAEMRLGIAVMCLRDTLAKNGVSNV